VLPEQAFPDEAALLVAAVCCARVCSVATLLVRTLETREPGVSGMAQLKRVTKPAPLVARKKR